MSRFLKFIVHTIVIITIICVAGLAVPQFLGIQTVIIKNDDQVTNLPLGSVTYAIPEAIGEVASGTEILVNDEGKYYRYSLSSVDQQNHTAVAFDPRSASGEQYSVQVRNYVPKVVITIGFLGYLLIATESIEGLIVIGLAVLFLVILYIIAELLKKDPDEDEYENGQEGMEETAYVKSKKELKREEKARAKRMKEEDAALLAEGKKNKKNKKKNRNIIRTGGFVDEVYEDELYADEDGNPTIKLDMNNNPMRAASAASDAHETLRREVAAATQRQIPPMYQEMPQVQPPQMPQMQPAPQMYQEMPQPMYQEMPQNMNVPYNQPVMDDAPYYNEDDEAVTQKVTPSVPEQPVAAQTINLEETARKASRRSARPSNVQAQPYADAPRQRMARQRLSAAELAERARRDGDAPEVLTDNVTNVTMFDYSDIIGGEPKD